MENLETITAEAVAIDSASANPRPRRKKVPRGIGAKLPLIFLVTAVVFYLLTFLHLRADFPSQTHWPDPTRFAGEGFYAAAPLHHTLQHLWLLPASANSAVAMPVWPLLLTPWLKLTTIGMAATRTLMLLFFGGSLTFLYLLLRQHHRGPLPAIALFLVTINPFSYAFNRLAILEPLIVLWLMLGLWVASKTREQDLWKQIVLGLILATSILTRPTAIFLAPAVLYLLATTIGWAENRWRRPVQITSGVAGVILFAYLLTVLFTGHFADLHALITSGHDSWSFLPRSPLAALASGIWISRALYPSALILVLLSTFWLRELWRLPLYGAMVTALAGTLAFAAFHTTVQPHFYLLLLMPVVAIVLLGIDALWTRKLDGIAGLLATIVAISAIAMIVKTIHFTLKPTYTYASAADGIAAIIRADSTANPLLLSTSGDDITLFTTLPAINQQLTTHGLDPLLGRYYPGWYLAWEGADDDQTKLIAQRYRLNERARYKVFDDPTHDSLVLYRLE